MKKSVKRLLVLGVAIVMVLGLIGCKNPDETTNTPEVTTTPDATGETKEDTKPAELVELTMIRMGTEPAAGMDEFYKQLDALTISDLNCTVRFQWIAWGEETTKIPLAITDGSVDLLCGGPWSSWSEYATKNGFADLTDLLSTVPDLVGFYNTNMGANHIESTKVDGKVYGFTQLNNGVGGDGFFWREDLRKTWGLEEITSLETLETYLFASKENGYQPGIADDRVLDFIWQMLAGGTYYVVPGTDNNYVATYEDPSTPILKYTTPEYKECLAVAEKWYKDGIIDSGVLSGRQGESQVLMAQDATSFELCNHMNVYDSTFVPAILEATPTAEFGYYNYGRMSDTPTFRPTSNTTMVSISSQSDNVETALKFIEKAYTDEKYSQLLQYGVDGIHYNNVNGTLSKADIPSENNFPTVTGFGNYIYVLGKSFASEQWGEVYTTEENRQLEAIAALDQYNPYEGFSFNSEEVKTEYAALANVISQYEVPLSCGVINESIDTDLATLLSQLESAGEPTIKAALTAQIAAR